MLSAVSRWVLGLGLALSGAQLGTGCAMPVEDEEDGEPTGTEAEAYADDAHEKIVGGRNAKPGEFPFFVRGRGCGGSLIWSDIILTAAHCQGAFSTVWVGARRNTGSESGEEIQSSEQVVHPQFNAWSMENDFMLVKLRNQVSSGNFIRLPSAGDAPEADGPLTVIGFGMLEEGGNIPKTLKKVTVDYIPHEDCNAAYPNKIDEKSMLCAGVDGGGKDSCQGDSGGPIFNSEGVQVGVVSWGYGCAQARYPGVYARVSSASEWIQKQLCEMSAVPPASCQK